MWLWKASGCSEMTCQTGGQSLAVTSSPGTTDFYLGRDLQGRVCLGIIEADDRQHACSVVEEEERSCSEANCPCKQHRCIDM